ncbi:MAG: hypothetical protein OXJ55_00530, partial [Caldilineaceae bacterium]|nr:hypothetical protein [Caldilineaceae bacterium]
NHYLSSESLLPWVKTSDEQPVARVDVRRVIQVAGVDPYAWKGYEKSPAEETRLYIRKATFDEE